MYVILCVYTQMFVYKWAVTRLVVRYSYVSARLWLEMIFINKLHIWTVNKYILTAILDTKTVLIIKL